MTESWPEFIGLILGLLIAIPIGIHMFRECFRNYSQFKKEIKEARGSEEKKLYDGEFTKAINHQFIELKVGFALFFPIIIFCLPTSSQAQLQKLRSIFIRSHNVYD